MPGPPETCPRPLLTKQLWYLTRADMHAWSTWHPATCKRTSLDNQPHAAEWALWFWKQSSSLQQTPFTISAIHGGSHLQYHILSFIMIYNILYFLITKNTPQVSLLLAVGAGTCTIRARDADTLWSTVRSTWYRSNMYNNYKQAFCPHLRNSVIWWVFCTPPHPPPPGFNYHRLARLPRWLGLGLCTVWYIYIAVGVKPVPLPTTIIFTM